AGTNQCVGGSTALSCVGAKGPIVELCNGIDDDCNSLVDDLPGGTVGGPCYYGPPGTDNVGICHGGQLGCGPTGIECNGDQLPQGETCNNLDDNCNGTVDDVPGLGTTCCPSGRCGHGTCTAGSLVC